MSKKNLTPREKAIAERLGIAVPEPQPGKGRGGRIMIIPESSIEKIAWLYARGYGICALCRITGISRHLLREVLADTEFQADAAVKATRLDAWIESQKLYK